MHPRLKDERPIVRGRAPSNTLGDSARQRTEPVAPEVAAERAANRIIQAVRKREEEELNVTNDA